MIQLALIIGEELHQMAIFEPEGEVFTPLSRWIPACANGGFLQLPKGWRIAGEMVAAQVSLRMDGNYKLTDGSACVWLLVRCIEQESLGSASVLMTERFTVGRSRSNHLCCKDGYLSAQHGVFSFGSDGVLVYEDCSTNGTFVNGKRLHHGCVRLQNGDQLDFPPLFRLIVDGVVLRLRYPKEQSGVLLRTVQPAQESGFHMGLFFQNTGTLRHFLAPRSVCTGAELMSAAAEQLKAEETTLLHRETVLCRGGTMEIIPCDTPVQLEKGTVLVVF